jgi:hypothetical protein
MKRSDEKTLTVTQCVEGYMIRTGAPWSRDNGPEDAHCFSTFREVVDFLAVNYDEEMPA